VAKVITSIPTASTKINGITFTAEKGQMISEEISDEVAAGFVKVPGFALVVPPKGKAPAATDPAT
jgi:hypothetical protein